jgi:allophanate hydrolase subunit 2
VFASASTHLLTGMGGFEGRAVRAGDRLGLGAPGERAPFDRAVDPSGLPGYRNGEPFRATEGPQADWFAPQVQAVFYDTPWQIALACDRMGIRLSGPSIRLASPRELATEGVLSGAIQVPPGGLPIVLFVEHQTTGGYPKLANVITADLARLGGLRPRDRMRFEPISLADARTILRAQEEALDALFS